MWLLSPREGGEHRLSLTDCKWTQQLGVTAGGPHRRVYECMSGTMGYMRVSGSSNLTVWEAERCGRRRLHVL